MLKIKKEISFEYLEENYKELKRRMWNDISYGLESDGLMILWNKKIVGNGGKGDDTLFDLIQAGLVEKVSDE